MLFSIVAAPTYIPNNSSGGFPFLQTHPASVICGLLDDGHSDQCEVIPRCRFYLHFSNN